MSSIIFLFGSVDFICFEFQVFLSFQQLFPLLLIIASPFPLEVPIGSIISPYGWIGAKLYPAA